MIHCSEIFKLFSRLNELDIYGTKPNMVKMVVGNKIDQPNREISQDDGFKFAKKHRTLFLETSAKTDVCIKEAFSEVVRKIIETDNLWEKNTYRDTVDVTSPGQSGQSCQYCSIT
jgi:Ras-related protein Rab-18